MPEPEEIYAQQLYKELVEKYGSGQPSISRIWNAVTKNNTYLGISIKIKGAGVNWSCIVAKGERNCKINCFDINRMDVAYSGPEYYTSFEINGQNKAYGRTFEKLETLEAVEEWINDKTLEQLYSTFSFIDKPKKDLERIRATIINYHPEIGNLPQNDVKKEALFSYSLYFSSKNRECRIYTYGYEPHPRCTFNWDGTNIFEIAGSDLSRLSHLIKRWVHDNEMPSDLKREFTEIDFGPLAEYYESGSGIEGEFMIGWDYIEEFYKKLNGDNSEDILRLIRTMREKGFDKTLRAGSSLYTLILSRSRRYGLVEGQLSVSFSFNYIPPVMEVGIRKSDQKLSFNEIAYNETIDLILKELEQEDIT